MSTRSSLTGIEAALVALSMGLAACGDGEDTSNTGASGGQATTGGAVTSGGLAMTGGDLATGGAAVTGGDPATGGAAVTGGDIATGGTSQNAECPRVTLSGPLPIVHQGDTTGLANLAESVRLEWGDAPDDTLLFTAPEAGDYHIEVTEEASTNGGCGASVHEADGTLYTAEWCPATNAVTDLDGYFAGATPIALEQGQQVMIWVSCSPWASVQAGPYTLVVEAWTD